VPSNRGKQVIYPEHSPTKDGSQEDCTEKEAQ
jgi:hypothetical protein